MKSASLLPYVNINIMTGFLPQLELTSLLMEAMCSSPNYVILFIFFARIFVKRTRMALRRVLQQITILVTPRQGVCYSDSNMTLFISLWGYMYVTSS